MIKHNSLSDIKIGNIDDSRCLQNSIKPFYTRKVCRNNCKYWNKIARVCKLNY